MKNNVTMLSGLKRTYRHDKSCRHDVDGQQCIFVSMERLINYYGDAGFATEIKYGQPAWEKHLATWERLNKAHATTMNGESGILIPITTA